LPPARAASGPTDRPVKASAVCRPLVDRRGNALDYVAAHFNEMAATLERSLASSILHRRRSIERMSLTP